MTGDAEGVGGALETPAGIGQGLAYEGGFEAGNTSAGTGYGGGEQDIVGVEERSFRQESGAQDGVAEFPDVAWPEVGVERGHGAAGKPEFGILLGEEVAGEGFDVLGPFAQRWDLKEFYCFASR